MKKPRIMILDPAGNMWGSERVLLDFIRSEAARNRDIALCCPPVTPLAKAAALNGIKTYETFIARLHDRNKISRLIAALNLYYSCKNYKADVIYVNQAGASRIALLVGSVLRIPVVPHVRLLEDVAYVEKLRVKKNLMPYVLAISKFIGDAFKDEGMRARVKILYDAYTLMPKTKERKSKNSKPKKICCAGRLVPNKGQNLLIKSIAALNHSSNEVVLNVYGAGMPGSSYEEELKALARQLNIKSEVTFNGYIDNVTREMARHDVVVIPSVTEPLGRVVFEAWDAGTVPVVGALSGGAAEVVTAANGGILYSSQTSESIAEALIRCLALTSEQRELMIANGRKWLDINCDSEKYSEKIFQYLDAAVLDYEQK